MRILLVNPNMTQAMTQSMQTIAQELAGPRAEIVALTASRGFPYIASRAEAQIAGGIALEMIADNLGGIDAVIIGAFGDPGLVPARELFDLPVIGMAEAAVMSAAMLGERFSVVTFSPLMTRWYSECVADTGLAARCTGVRSPAVHDVDVSLAKSDLRAELIALATSAVRDDGADVVLLGGAPLSGLAPSIASEVPAIVIDPITAATAQALALAGLRLDYGQRACKPAAKYSVGLAPSLARAIAQETQA
jgi:Asp/Glu/hydantoin racemase